MLLLVAINMVDEKSEVDPVCTRVCLYVFRYFRSEDSKESVRVSKVGNATAKTELTYEYGVRKKKKEVESTGASAATDAAPDIPPLQVDGKPHLPFQLQVEYTSKDGSRLMRVITDAKPITRDRIAAEKGATI